MTLIKKMDLAAQQLLGETLKWSDDVIIDNDIAQLMDDKAASFQCKTTPYTAFGMICVVQRLVTVDFNQASL